MALRADDVDLGRDRDLVARFQNGDPEAFDDLYRRYFDRLHRYCRRHTRDNHEAEEVAQEAFVKALRSMHSLEGERRFYPWMTVIAKRITIDRHRKLSRVELTDQPDLGSVDPDVDHLFSAVDAANVREALANLGPRHRDVLLLREAEGLSYADIAIKLDVPVTTVEALLHRARKALRREYAAITGERRGVWGIPLLGWLSTKAHGLRARLGEHWVEVGAVAAPVVVGAATAAFVLVPGSGAADDPRPAAPAVEEVSAVSPPSSTGPVVAGTLDVPEPGPLADATPPAATPDPEPTPAPTAQAGPVDVFTGPDGADHAREQAERMPINTTVGPAAGGADGQITAEDLATFVGEVQSYAGESPAIQSLLGGNP